MCQLVWRTARIVTKRLVWPLTLVVAAALAVGACAGPAPEPYGSCTSGPDQLRGSDPWVRIEAAALRRETNGRFSAVVDLQSPVPVDSFGGSDGVLGVWLERGWKEPIDDAPNGTIGSTLVATYRLESGAATVSPLSGARPQRDLAEEYWMQNLDGGRLTVDGDKLLLDVGSPDGKGESDVPDKFEWSVGVFFQTIEQSADRYDWSSDSWCPGSAFDDPGTWAPFPGDSSAVRAAKETFGRASSATASSNESPNTEDSPGSSTTTTSTAMSSSTTTPARLDETQAAQRFLDAWNASDVELARTVADEEVVESALSEPSNRDAVLLRCRNWNEIAEGEYQGSGTAVCDGRYTAQWMSENEYLQQAGGTVEIYLDGGASAGYRVSGVGFNDNPPGWAPVD